MPIPQGKEKFKCLYSYVLLNFTWLSLFLCNTTVSFNCCVGVKEKRAKKSYRNQDRDSEAEKF